MRYEDAVKLEELAVAAHDAKVYFQELGKQNTFNLSANDARALAVKYELARAELNRADGLLMQAQGQMFAYGRLK